MIVFESCLAMQSWVNREYKRGVLGSSSVEDQRGRCVATYPHHLGAVSQEVQDPVAEGGVKSQDPSLSDELGGYYGVER